MWSQAAGPRSLLILCSVFRSRAQPSPSLLPLCPACLPISHPSRARVCMYIAIIAPSNPHSDVPVVPPFPSMFPIPARHDFSSPGSERDRSVPPSSFSSATRPLSGTVSALLFQRYQANWTIGYSSRRRSKVSMRFSRCLAKIAHAADAPFVICGDLDHILD